MLDVRCSQKKRAFTLIELVIVIVLIGIAAALIIPEMKGGYQDALLRSTSRELVNVFSIASSRAVSLNQLHRVRIEAGTGRYVIEKRTRETVQGDEYKPLNDVSEAEGTFDKRISVRVHNLDDSQRAAPARDNSQTRAGHRCDFILFRWHRGRRGSCCCATSRDTGWPCASIPSRRT